MGMLIIPLLLIAITAPHSDVPADVLADFGRFSKAINAEIALVDQDGTVREGILTAATKDDVTVRFGSGLRTFSRATVMSAERVRDSRKDGAIKGAIFGAITGVFAMQGLDSAGEGVAAWFGSVAIYSGIGYLIDAAQTHREPIYRGAPVAPGASVKIAVRF